ncbi:hypothetical protein THOB06_50041 [Vibrio rotiferianus]|nr:hypothetical protein THOB06_50041 [Vibrio rotiferianus]
MKSICYLSVVLNEQYSYTEKITMEYDVKLTEREVKLLIDLINKEMSGIVGDLGYLELSKLLIKLDNSLD